MTVKAESNERDQGPQVTKNLQKNGLDLSVASDDWPTVL